MITLDTWREMGQTLEFRGHAVQIYEGGRADGHALLLIHGFPTAAWDWHRIWGSLGETFRLIAPDLLGFGFSAKPRDADYSFRLQADLCEAILASRAVDRYHVLAHDYGDTVAQELLYRRGTAGSPSGLRSACFLNGGLFPERHQPRPIQKLLAGPLGPLLARMLGENQAIRSLSRVFGPDTQPDAAESEAFWTLIDSNGGRLVMPQLLRYIREREVNRDRWVGALIDSPVPLMFIDGMLDPVSGANMTSRWRELLPDRPVIELPGIGHYPQIEAAGAVLESTLPFFAGVAD